MFKKNGKSTQKSQYNFIHSEFSVEQSLLACHFINMDKECPAHVCLKRKGKFSFKHMLPTAANDDRKGRHTLSNKTIYPSLATDSTVTCIFMSTNTWSPGLVQTRLTDSTLVCHTMLERTSEVGSNQWGRRGKHPEGSDIIYLADAPSLAQVSRHPLGSSAHPGNHAVKLDKFSCEEVETEAGN